MGVGQSETAVADLTDLFLLLLLPGGGDELQGIKRGIVELADLIVVNKADGEMSAAAERAAADYRNALHFLRPRSAHWSVPVATCSALEGRGIDQIWKLVDRLPDSDDVERRAPGQAGQPGAPLAVERNGGTTHGPAPRGPRCPGTRPLAGAGGQCRPGFTPGGRRSSS